MTVNAEEAASSARTLASFSLKNKVCAVTGAARGLGFEFCKAFLNSGSVTLALLDLKVEDLTAAKEELEQHATSSGIKQVDILAIECNVSNEDLVKVAFDKIVEAFGRVDVVVASAGIVENYSALEYPADRAKLLFDINVHGVFFTARQAARCMMPNQSGSIILIGSMSANIVNTPQLQTPYNASKAAVKHMAASLAVEWAKHGIRVNCLSPGYMLTKLTRTILEGDPELKKTWESQTPMGRMGDPEDLAGPIVFMASDASKFMTGSEIRVDGGYTCI
ncbi:hypothetical protein CC1G_01096 [Coprinopsis cinerea okayama7|uniref:Ig-like domain-containing protein n=1 Tax=Coprinopsis cinerea (strain Okayama-7 / 130 / ATCC MYA-4618 / FGSC 9003) TaxID=240176 RepID=A8NEI2_COPC7|nr:hypothetical protein CC1G_01096 [Coprinopsis cinerea okayama7\|eukprot:XP_001833034.2 hypothetical protein CC1G_01096 [Coprinopsis cinerea okayama7\